MNGTKKIEHHETVVEAQPSPIALENEKRVTRLEESYRDLEGKMGEMVGWMRKLETNVENLSSSISSKLDKLTHRPAGTYIGIISIMLVVVGMCSTLIIFVQDSRLEPIRQQIKGINDDDDRSFNQWVEDFALLQRDDQILIDKGLKDSVDERLSKPYNPRKLPKRHGAAPSRN